MIYTITLNPLIERIVEVEELLYDDVNQVVAEHKKPGGKGIDVSRVIKELGGQSVAMGFAGGYSGLELIGMLVNEGIVTDFTRINEESRSSITIYQRKKKIQTLLSTSCPPIGQIEVDSFFRKVQEVSAGSYVVISGDVPDSMSDSFFAQMITTLKERDIKVFLDTDNEALKLGVSAGPFLIKPNVFEFGRLVENSMNTVEEIAEYVKPYRDSVEYIIVSMGARGAAGFSKEGDYRVTPPKVNVRNSVGAGDSMLGGVVFAMSQQNSFEDALRLGIACGTAATLSAAGDLCTKKDIDFIKKEVIIEKI